MFTGRLTFSNDKYKLVSYNKGQSYELYDMINDQEETKNIASQFPEITAEMKKDFLAWYNSARASFEGKEYGTKSFDRLQQKWGGSLDVQAKSSKKKKSKK